MIRIEKTANDELRVAIEKALRDNDNYCPCKIRSPETKCMCKEFNEQSTSGPCRCGLYEKTVTE